MGNWYFLGGNIGWRKVDVSISPWRKILFWSFPKQVKSWVRFHLNIFLEPISEMNHLLPLLKSLHCLLSLSPVTALQVTWSWMWLYMLPISKHRGSLFIYSTNIFWKPIFQALCQKPRIQKYKQKCPIRNSHLFIKSLGKVSYINNFHVMWCILNL